jgi:hypothetical protein
MDGMDAVGDAVTGSLLARAVEPRAGEASPDGHTHETNCLNCGTRLSGPYCAACGQKAHVHRSVRGFFQDFLAGLFNFEGKIWRTLPMLAWCPGLMTRRYIAGERARFISPVALYLFTVFLMFATLNFTGALGSSGIVNPKKQLAAEITDDQQQLARIEARRKEAAAQGKSTVALDNRIARKKADIEGEQKVLAGGALAVADEGPIRIGERLAEGRFRQVGRGETRDVEVRFQFREKSSFVRGRIDEGADTVSEDEILAAVVPTDRL